ncbi:hypothetical protein [Arthrobacter sp. 4R501]|uniref:hypothetical protein n=1 Tax=Arthrobacter sp. 4R501 TaxID=2058886 RepID=UPI000CE3FEFC|nr:hypothetical protein [Arthrobacter sp. 4R501]
MDELDQTSHAREGALSALREVAEVADRERFGFAIDSFEADDYEQIVRLAWRYQFDDDRSKFKRELRQLQGHVSERILARLELMNE